MLVEGWKLWAGRQVWLNVIREELLLSGRSGQHHPDPEQETRSPRDLAVLTASPCGALTQVYILQKIRQARGGRGCKFTW